MLGGKVMEMLKEFIGLWITRQDLTYRCMKQAAYVNLNVADP